jgi:hypothetical protein
MNKDKINGIARKCLGLKLQLAKELIVTEGLIYRIISQDGLQFEGLSDDVPYRISLEVIDNKVSDARVG